jgi:transposase-like protein
MPGERDATPRRRQMQALVAQWERSGEPVGEFARRQGITPSTFGWWRRELRRLAGSSKPVQLVEISRGEAANGFDLRLPNGVIVRVPVGFDEAALRRLLGVLEC